MSLTSYQTAPSRVSAGLLSRPVCRRLQCQNDSFLTKIPALSLPHDAKPLAPDDPPANPVTLGEKTLIPGLQIARINPVVIAKLGLPLTLEGVVVTESGPYGGRAGLQPGDVIRAINGDAIQTTDDVLQTLDRSGRWLRLDLLRRGQAVSLRFRL